MTDPISAIPLLAAANATKGSKPSFDWSAIDWTGILVNWCIALLIIVIGAWFAKKLSRTIEKALKRAHVESTLSTFLRNVSYAILMVLVIVTALSKIGVPATSLATVIGAAGLAVGLALRDSLSNIASGVMLIVLRPMRTGDHVIAGGIEGYIEEIRVFQTRIRAFDHRIVTVPNSTITTAPIINYTTMPTRRAEILVGVGYDDDLKKAQEILLSVAKDNALILDDPAPYVRITNLGESSVDLMLYAFALNADFTLAKSQLIEGVRNQIQSKGLSIPYPQRDLHVYHHGAEANEFNNMIVDDGDMPKPPPSPVK